jgi:hypothetical protein
MMKRLLLNNSRSLSPKCNRLMTSSHEIETKTYTNNSSNNNGLNGQNGYNGQNGQNGQNGRVSCAVSRSVNWFYNQSAIDIAAAKVTKFYLI